MDCWMEIQAGKGPWAAPVSGIVPLGSTLTLVVAINDYRGKSLLLMLYLIPSLVLLSSRTAYYNNSVIRQLLLLEYIVTLLSDPYV